MTNKENLEEATIRFLLEENASITKSIEKRMDDIAKDYNYFDDFDTEYNVNSKDLWMNKYTFKDKWNELKEHFEDEEFYSLFNGINGANLLIGSGNRVGIILYRYRWQYKSYIKEIRQALQEKIEGGITTIDSNDDYKNICMKFTLKNLENYPEIQNIVDTTIQKAREQAKAKANIDTSNAKGELIPVENLKNNMFVIKFVDRYFLIKREYPIDFSNIEDDEYHFSEVLNNKFINDTKFLNRLNRAPLRERCLDYYCAYWLLKRFNEDTFKKFLQQ